VNNQNIRKSRALIAACIRRDRAAWSVFAEMYAPLIARSVKCRLRKHGFSESGYDIEDISQTVLASIWEERKLESVANVATIPYWLAVVSGNIAMEHVRKNRIFGARAVSFDTPEGEAIAASLLPPAAGPAEELARQDLVDAIENAVDDFPVPEKFAIKLYLIHEKTYNEIADLMRLPLDTVKSHIKRAREKLHTLLEDYR